MIDSSDSHSQLKVRDVIPSQYQCIFDQKYDTFNLVQSILFDQALGTNVRSITMLLLYFCQKNNPSSYYLSKSVKLNLVIAAPTGCGKTVIHELAILRMMMTREKSKIKCLYIAPTKALCQQRWAEWTAKFSRFSLRVVEVTGDSDLSHSFQLIAQASIIITTPEKWDSLTRSWRDHIFLFGAVDLLLVDEIHHLGEERGSALETVIVRMRRLSELMIARTTSANPCTLDPHRPLKLPLRIIALSATLPNLSDIGNWFDCEPQAVHYFDMSYRPTPLTIHVLSMGSGTNQFLFERSLDSKVKGIIDRFSDGKPVLIFCASKNSTEKLANLLCQQYGGRIRRDLALRSLVAKGVGYHHAGLSPDDRMIIEQNYINGSIHILCSTSTLAHGVNLPAHLVVVKGTNCWRGGTRGYEKMERSEIIQMLGRAGRPGFDDHGVAVIMTSAQDKDYYSSISLSADIVESTLPEILPEAICAEIHQTVITSLEECVDWIKNTYYYIRVKKNPIKYGFNSMETEVGLEGCLLKQSSKVIRDLFAASIINYDESTHFISPRPEAAIMTRNIIKFKTMVLLIETPDQCTLSQFIAAICNAEELHKPVRKSEKKILNDMMRSIRFPLKIKVQEPNQKTYVLLQAAVSRFEIKDFSLRVEQSEIVSVTLRVLSAMLDLCKEKGHGMLLLNTILLDRSLRCRLWEVNYDTVFRQCNDLSTQTLNALTLNRIRDFGDILGCSLQWLQQRLSCSPAEGHSIMQFASILNRSKRVVRGVISESHQLCIDVSANINSNSPLIKDLNAEKSCPTYQLVCFDALTGQVLCYRKIEYSQNDCKFSVPLPLDHSGRINDVKIFLLSNIIGIDSCQVSESAATVPETSLEAQKAVNRLTSKVPKGNEISGFTVAPEASSAAQGAVTQWTSKVPKVNEITGYLTPRGADILNASNRQKEQCNHRESERAGNECYSRSPQVSSSFLALDDSDKLLSKYENSLTHFRMQPEDLTDICSAYTKPYTIEDTSPSDRQSPIIDSSRAVCNELALVRSKANELLLDSIPVKRLRKNYSEETSTFTTTNPTKGTASIDHNDAKTKSVERSSLQTRFNEEGRGQESTDFAQKRKKSSQHFFDSSEEEVCKADSFNLTSRPANYMTKNDSLPTTSSSVLFDIQMSNIAEEDRDQNHFQSKRRSESPISTINNNLLKPEPAAKTSPSSSYASGALHQRHQSPDHELSSAGEVDNFENIFF